MVVPESDAAVQPSEHCSSTELNLVVDPGSGFEANQDQSGPELEEVRKLQELVRRLEIQNQQLRNRGGTKCFGANSNLTGISNINDRTVGDKSGQIRLEGNINLTSSVMNLEMHLEANAISEEESVESNNSKSCLNEKLAPDEETREKMQSENFNSLDTAANKLLFFEEETGSGDAFGQSTLDEVEVLDLEDCSEGEEDTWLYVSPKKIMLAEQRPESPLKWCRQVFDHPSPETEAACRTFMCRLDQTTRWKSIYSSSAQCVYSSTSEAGSSGNALGSPGYLKSTNKTLLTCGSSGYMSIHSALSSQSSIDSELSTSDDSISMGYKLQDLTDVQIMARLQEESLRQDYASSSASVSRRSSSASLHSLRRGTYSDQEFDTYSLEDEEDDCSFSLRSAHRYSPSPLSSPRCQSPSSVVEYSRVVASRVRPPRRSFQGPVPELVKFTKSEDDMRRSMPNLARTSLRSLEAVRNSRSMESNLQGPSNRISRLHSSTGLPSTKLSNHSGNAQSPLSVRVPVKALGPTASMGASRQPPKATGAFGTSNGSIRRVQSPTYSGSGSSSGGVSSSSRGAAGFAGKHTPSRSRTSFGAPSALPRSRVSQPSRRSIGLTKTCSPVTDESWKDGCY
ncbi:SLAIN motif-containing protein-like isoform X1 [Erpetoichthys calabaricus]|uniref:Zgc:66447 n=1 Tax=Erpetoichthys calabaricus TaxID=27687 RepID=A0A8C4XB09_ERPCA|nr:SLAIN motif-containing protein-like isoform X1 [Erpetoichthys calabaricus]